MIYHNGKDYALNSKLCNGQKDVAEDYIKSSGVAPSRQLSPLRVDATRLSLHVRNMLLPNTLNSKLPPNFYEIKQNDFFPLFSII